MLSQQDENELKQYCAQDERFSLLVHRLDESYRMNLSRISHEIRNPVTLINSFLQLTQSRHPEVAEYQTWQPLLENMDYLKQLLESLSDYNNSEILHKEELSLTSLLDSLVCACRPSLVPSEIRFEKAGPVPSAFFDRTKLRAAILNLIRNAGEALKGKPGGTIRVILSFDGSFFHIRVTNNGPQIPPEHLEHLFEPFVTHKKKGSGLGLAIVKNVIQAHDGHISVSSTVSETSFTIVLPLSYDAPSACALDDKAQK